MIQLRRKRRYNPKNISPDVLQLGNMISAFRKAVRTGIVLAAAEAVMQAKKQTTCENATFAQFTEYTEL